MQDSMRESASKKSGLPSQMGHDTVENSKNFDTNELERLHEIIRSNEKAKQYLDEPID